MSTRRELLEKLFEPTNIGTMELRNRVVMPPMAVGFSRQHAVTQRYIDYMIERARSGVGLIGVEGAVIDRNAGLWGTGALLIDSDEFIAPFNELVEEVHLYGAKIALQITHPGAATTLAMSGGKQPVSASEIPTFEPGVNAKSLTVEEIEEIKDKWANAAQRAKKAGFDAIHIDCAAGYLLCQFLSPYTNKRTDSYGGDLDGRVRLVVEIIEHIRKRVGDDFPIIVDLVADEFIEGGIKLEESKVIAQKLEAAGVNAIRPHHGTSLTYHYVSPSHALPRGCFIHLAEGIKKVVTRAKVITDGRINDPILAERILQEEKADLIAMGRAFIADPEWLKKAADGKLEDIRKCIGCTRCFTRLFADIGVKCTVNAAMGKERDLKIKVADKPRKVLVVGGGPGGMEAARVAALEGHEVILCEKNGQLGGQSNLAAVAPYKEETKNITEYLINQVNKLGVKVELKKEVTPEAVKEIKPDVVIVATGAKPLIPDIIGVNQKNVITAWEVLSGQVETEDNVLIVGGGTVGCETAEFLKDKGKEVTIIEMLSELGMDMEPFDRCFFLERFAKSGIKALTNTKVEEIIDRGVIVITSERKRQEIEGASIVLAMGSMANTELWENLRKEKAEIHVIGDCREPRKMFEAIHEGSHIAREIGRR